ncbi:MAG: amino acid adenylation domain-containing protein [Sphingobacteriales bacterium]|nr:MAG: amino acid adenylation domain-containing protein [Sphingobacteriales bacterium]
MKEHFDLHEVYGAMLSKDTQSQANSNKACNTSIIQYKKELGNDLLQGIDQFCAQHGIDRQLFCLLAFRILLFRHNNTESIGVWDAAKHQFINIIDASEEDNGETTVAQMLESTKAVRPDNNSDQAISAKPAIVFGYTAQALGEGAELFNYKGFKVAFQIAESSSELQLMIQHAATKYANLAAPLAEHFMQVVSAILQHHDKQIGEFPIISNAEQDLLQSFNDTLAPFPEGESMISRFGQRAQDSPDHIAAYKEDETITYGELNKRANQLAHYLLSTGIERGDNIGILTTRSFDMLVAMLATLKSGSAYVPVPPEYPAERHQYMLKQSGVKKLLTNVDQKLTRNTTIEAIDIRNVDCSSYSDKNPDVAIDVRQLAYTIYTSGSTGVPKGVMIEHQSAVNLINWVNTEYNVGADDRLLFITSMGFDLSVYDIFGTLSAGASLVIAEKDDVLDTARLADLMQRFGITIWDTVPSTMDYLTNGLTASKEKYLQDKLRVVLLSGDWIPVALPEKIKTFFPAARVISLGGATEGTVWSNSYEVTEPTNTWRSIPYGRPIANNTFYILNEQLQPVPCGVVGELFIGGIGVAKGYANDPVKTAASFLPDPFTDQWGGRMYRTGDLGRLMPNGIMEFIGRKDNQVKIRGFRVELGEIENVIRQGQTVSHAVVIPSEDRQNLTAFVVPAKYYDRDTIVARMKRRLPEYMIPGKWVELDAMPLTDNGKINVKALKGISGKEQLKDDFVAPAGETETALAEVWQQILGVKQVGVNDNFFELGGQSLLAVELITEMEKKLGRGLPINILYKCPTIAQLSSFLQTEVVEKKWKSLTAIKPNGTKTPIYLIHGDGIYLSSFQNLADFVDADQPVYSLLPIGINGNEEQYETIVDIARHYVSEIMEHNSTDTYALGGYSFGGYVAIEMKKQLEAAGKKVKLLALFDTNAENVLYTKSWVQTLPHRIKRQVPKFFFIVKSAIKEPQKMLRYQYSGLAKRVNKLCYRLGIKKEPELKGINRNINKIGEKNLKALREYQLAPFDKVYLFKAKSRLYFVDDMKFLGWSQYAQQGVHVYDVPGDHSSIFERPNVSELAKSLQHALDNC